MWEESTSNPTQALQGLALHCIQSWDAWSSLPPKPADKELGGVPGGCFLLGCDKHYPKPLKTLHAFAWFKLQQYIKNPNIHPARAFLQSAFGTPTLGKQFCAVVFLLEHPWKPAESSQCCNRGCQWLENPAGKPGMGQMGREAVQDRLSAVHLTLACCSIQASN